MPNHYDNLLKESTEGLLPMLLQQLLGLDYQRATPQRVDLQKTIDREADFVFRIRAAQPYLLQVDFQAKNDPRMHKRMLLYAALLFDKYGLPVQQVVIFLGKGAVNMPTEVTMPDYTFRYRLYDFREISAQTLLASNRPEAVIFALIADWRGREPDAVATDIVERLRALVGNENEMEKYLSQLAVLSGLRNLQTTVKRTVAMLKLDFKKTFIYKEGERSGERKGERKGRKENQRENARAMLSEGFSTDVICRITQLRPTEVEKLRAGLSPEK